MQRHTSRECGNDGAEHLPHPLSEHNWSGLAHRQQEDGGDVAEEVGFLHVEPSLEDDRRKESVKEEVVVKLGGLGRGGHREEAQPEEHPADHRRGALGEPFVPRDLEVEPKEIQKKQNARNRDQLELDAPGVAHGCTSTLLTA